MLINQVDFSNDLAITELYALSVNKGQKVLDTWSTSSTLEVINLLWDDFPESAKNALKIVDTDYVSKDKYEKVLKQVTKNEIENFRGPEHEVNKMAKTFK